MENRKPIKIDWANLRHSEELQEVLNPVRPSGAEFNWMPDLYPVDEDELH